MRAFHDVAVIGAGTMGHGPALVHVLGGCRVGLTDRDPAVRERAQALIETARHTLAQARVERDVKLLALRKRLATIEKEDRI